MPPLLSREQAKAITDRALSFATADETRVNLRAGWSGNTRFAGGEITTAGSTTDTAVTITSTIGRRRASASTNVLDDAGLQRVVQQAERLARLAPEDPEFLPELGPQQYVSVDAYADSTADLTPEARATAVQRVLGGAREAAGAASVPADDLFVAGFLEASAGVAMAVATSKGLFAYHPATSVSLSTTVRTPDGTGSGYAAAGANDWSRLDPTGMGRRAAQKAVASRDPQPLEPGRYTAILEARAVADFIPLLLRALQARTADEGRSPFSKPGGGTRVGEKIADERVTLLSNPADPELLALPFDEEGLPVRAATWIEHGVLKELAYSRWWAEQKGKQPSGGGGLKMLGTGKSVEDLIASTERGILVTHFFYVRMLEARTVTLTGLTRDGTFLIERGKITRPLKNFRWNDSPLLALNRIEEIGRAERVEPGLVMPSLKIRDFNFTSLSDAV
ncbi:MAG TPA: TldD/PmbA family protein [Gemmatimonadaceae bacterium]|nr:TldD/PmbA family protein [Gemmatimonadaceae bacterium]